MDKVTAYFIDQLSPHFKIRNMATDERARWLKDWETQLGSLKADDIDILAKWFIRNHSGAFPTIAAVLEAMPQALGKGKGVSNARNAQASHQDRVAKAYADFMAANTARVKRVCDNGRGYRLRADLRHHENDGRMAQALAYVETLPALDHVSMTYAEFLDSLP